VKAEGHTDGVGMLSTRAVASREMGSFHPHAAFKYFSWTFTHSYSCWPEFALFWDRALSIWSLWKFVPRKKLLNGYSVKVHMVQK